MRTPVTLESDSPCIQFLCAKDKRLAKVISMVGPITYIPYNANPYAFLVHEIIEQMLSIKAGQAIYNRLELLCDGVIAPETISQLTDDQIRSAGIANNKVSYIRHLTSSILKQELDLDQLCFLSDEEIYARLITLKGIGHWTVKMYLIFVLDRSDILPYEDAAFLQSYKWMYNTKDCTPKSIIKRCKKWKPYSSIAARYLYKALDLGFTKNAFCLTQYQRGNTKCH